MANHLPPSFWSKSVAFAGASSINDRNMALLEQLILDITNSERRENALAVLSKQKEIFNDLAPLLWHSTGTITALLQEVTSVYPFLTPPVMTPAQSTRVCNALALINCVASHAETRKFFMDANLPLYLYAFLNTTCPSRPFEYVRLTSLGVIGSLVKVDDPEVIRFFLQTEIVPLCLRTMDYGSDLSKTVATFIIEKVLTDDIGLEYMCINAERFFALAKLLGKMVTSPAVKPPPRLLKHIIRCYLRLTDHPRACSALGTCLPDSLKDPNYIRDISNDPEEMYRLEKLFHNVSNGGVPPQGFDPYSMN